MTNQNEEQHHGSPSQTPHVIGTNQLQEYLSCINRLLKVQDKLRQALLSERQLKHADALRKNGSLLSQRLVVVANLTKTFAENLGFTLQYQHAEETSVQKFQRQGGLGRYANQKAKIEAEMIEKGKWRINRYGDVEEK